MANFEVSWVIKMNVLLSALLGNDRVYVFTCMLVGGPS
ncbi:hypothetical protein Pla52n_39370 [Stieleria varia]|uniref:Uncharacterized protein n=1 Tax=Stieleria varia TaxID=2528005 RepID=A0A5C6ATT2_9BACT|nr:hypothetical protein Pla52n_39370 [Stieleria varia]